MSWTDRIRQELHEISLTEISIEATLRRHFLEHETILDEDENTTIPIEWYSVVSKNTSKESPNRSLTFQQKRSQKKQTPLYQTATPCPIQHRRQTQKEKRLSTSKTNVAMNTKINKNCSFQTRNDNNNFYTVKEARPTRKMAVHDTSNQNDNDVLSKGKNDEIEIDSQGRESLKDDKDPSSTYYSNKNIQNCSQQGRSHTLQSESTYLPNQNQPQHVESEKGNRNNTNEKENNYSKLYSDNCGMDCNQHNYEKNVSHHELTMRTTSTADLDVSINNKNRTQQQHETLEQINLKKTKSDVEGCGESIESDHVSDKECDPYDEEPISKEHLHNDRNVAKEEMSDKLESHVSKNKSKAIPTDHASDPSKITSTLSQAASNITVSDSSYTSITTTQETLDDAVDAYKLTCEKEAHTPVSSKNKSFCKSIPRKSDEVESLNNSNHQIPHTIEVDITKVDVEETQFNEYMSCPTCNIFETPNKLDVAEKEEREESHLTVSTINGTVNLDSDNFVCQSLFSTNIGSFDCNNLDIDSQSRQHLITKNNTSIMTQLDQQFNDTKNMLEKTDRLLLSSSTVLNLRTSKE